MTGDELPAQRANRIADAVEDIEQNLTRLRAFRHLSRKEYTASDEQDRRDAVERKFEKLTEATLDITAEICKQERGAVPDRRKDIVAALAEEGVINEDLAKRLRAAVGFRDVLSHTYGAIVNDDLVYDALQNDLGRYADFVDAVDSYVSRYVDD